MCPLPFPHFPRPAPNTKDLDVFIKRNQESGFGFRVLGGEGPDQPVSTLPERLIHPGSASIKTLGTLWAV